jgi:hypothetical protein
MGHSEVLNIQTTLDIQIEDIESLSIESVPVMDKTNQFKKFSKICTVTLRKGQSHTHQVYQVPLPELKRIKKLLTDYYGRNLKLTHTKVVGQKALKATRQLPMTEWKYRDVYGVNWTYEVLAPPFAKIMEQRAEANSIKERTV